MRQGAALLETRAGSEEKTVVKKGQPRGPAVNTPCIGTTTALTAGIWQGGNISAKNHYQLPFCKKKYCNGILYRMCLQMCQIDVGPQRAQPGVLDFNPPLNAHASADFDDVMRGRVNIDTGDC